MKRFYLSLTRGLVGYYVLFEAPNEDVVRKHAAKYFGRIWCSVYSGDYFEQRIAGRYSTERVINVDRPIVLEVSEWE